MAVSHGGVDKAASGGGLPPPAAAGLTVGFGYIRFSRARPGATLRATRARRKNQ